MFWIVKPKMNDGDSAVTGQYIQIIQKAIEKIGKKYQVCSPEQTFDKKKDTIIVVDCLQAFSYQRPCADGRGETSAQKRQETEAPCHRHYERVLVAGGSTGRILYEKSFKSAFGCMEFY